VSSGLNKAKQLKPLATYGRLKNVKKRFFSKLKCENLDKERSFGSNVYNNIIKDSVLMESVHEKKMKVQHHSSPLTPVSIFNTNVLETHIIHTQI
jgi:hypothetical protein